MKKFSDMTIDEVINVINQSEELRDMFDQKMRESARDYILDNLACFDGKSVSYSISACELSYFRVKDTYSFFEGVEKARDVFRLVGKTGKLFNRCKKLRGTNLFDYWAKRLCESYYETQFKNITDFIQDACFELHQGSVGEKSKVYVVYFFYGTVIADYLWDEETKTFYKPCEVSA